MGEEEDVGFLAKIRLPRLEDAGLEDCALPPDSIMEAFFKAAASVSSRSASDADESGGDCANNSSPVIRSTILPSDALVEIDPLVDSPGHCAAEKAEALIGDEDLGGGTAAGKEEVTIVPAAASEVEEKGGGGPICVDGIRELKIGEKKMEEVI